MYTIRFIARLQFEVMWLYIVKRQSLCLFNLGLGKWMNTHGTFSYDYETNRLTHTKHLCARFDFLRSGSVLLKPSYLQVVLFSIVVSSGMHLPEKL